MGKDLLSGNARLVDTLGPTLDVPMQHPLPLAVEIFRRIPGAVSQLRQRAVAVGEIRLPAGSEAGKELRFPGLIAGWGSNLADGYCSLSHLGCSAENPPEDFDRERE